MSIRCALFIYSNLFKKPIKITTFHSSSPIKKKKSYLILLSFKNHNYIPFHSYIVIQQPIIQQSHIHFFIFSYNYDCKHYGYCIRTFSIGRKS